MNSVAEKADLVVLRNVRSAILSKCLARQSDRVTALSSLGRKAYLAYWSDSICRTILSNPSNRSRTVDQIVQQTWIAPEDVVMILSETAMIMPNKLPDGSVMLVRGKIETWVRAHETAAATPAIDRTAFTQNFRDQKHELEAKR